MKRAVLVLAVAAFAAAGGPPAEAAQRLGDPPAAVDQDLARATAMDTGPDGLATVLVRRRGHAVVRRARPGQPFGGARRLPLGDNPTSPTVAAGVGFAALAWTHFDATYFPGAYDREEPCCRRLRAVLLERSGRVTRPRTLSSPGANVLGALGSVRGRRAALAWMDRRGVRTSVGVRGRGFRRPVTITTSQRSTLLAVALPRATPHVFLLVGYNRSRIEEAWRAHGHTHRVDLGPFDVYPFVPEAVVAATPDGHLLIAVDFFRREPRLRRLLVFARRPGHRLHATRVRVPLASATATAVALGPSGRGLVATGGGRRVFALRAVDSRGRVGSPRTLAAGGLPIASVMAIASSGAGAIGVHVYHGTGARRRDTLVAWRLGPDGRPGPRRTVSLRDGDVRGALAATIDGRVAWYQGGSSYATLVR